MPKNDTELEDLPEVDEDFGTGLDDSKTPPPISEAVDDAEPEEVEEDAPAPVTFRDILSKRNVNIPDDVDEAEYLGQMLDRFAQFGQQYQRAEAEKQLYAQQLALLQQQAFQAQQPRPPEQPKVPELKGLLSHWKKVPDWDDNWAQLVKRNEQNELIPIPGAAPDLPQRIRERQMWEERAQRLFFENPQQFIYEAMENHPSFQKPQQELQQLRQEFAEYQDRVEAQQVVNQLRETIYEPGTQNFTPAGNAYLAVVEQMRQAGITNTQLVNQIAQIAMSGYAQQAPPVKETPSQKKKAAQITFAKQAAAKSTNKARKSKPQEHLGDEYAIERHAMKLMREAGIDPHALAEVG